MFLYVPRVVEWPFYGGLVEEENNNSIKQERKMGTKIRELERITVIYGVNGGGLVKEVLTVEALI